MISSLANRSSIEPLEDRIAPALLVNGANLLGGAGNPTSGETSVGGDAATIVKVLSGQAIVWFDNGSIFSISFGPNTSLEIHGNVFGDIVGNLTAAGTLSDSDNNPANGEDGNSLLANNLVGLKTFQLGPEDGDVNNIITGGSISGLSIHGQLLGAYAGDGVFRAESNELQPGGDVLSSVGALDINPVAANTQSTFDFTKAGSILKPGASISTGEITQAVGLQLFAGSGLGATGANGAGGAGGGVSFITIDSAKVPTGAPNGTPSYDILGGDGSNGTTGGAGGSINHIIEKTSSGPVTIHAGKGGTGSTAAGGVGGSVSNLDLESNSAFYTVNAGNGGNGAPAGNGGQMVNNNFTNRTPVSGIIVHGDFTGDGIDDILTIDAATGQMLIYTQDNPNPGTGTTATHSFTTQFHELTQYTDSSNNPVVLINSAGETPIDAFAADVNGDGLLDIVVAYKDSDSLAVYLNHNDGSFFDPSIGTNGDFADVVTSLGYSPAKIASNAGGQFIVVAENVNGGSNLHALAHTDGSTVSDLAFTLSTGMVSFTQPVADVVYDSGGFFAAFTNGTISSLQAQAIDASKPFVATTETVGAGLGITGGLTDLDVDSTGNRLLALSATGHTVTVFDTSNGGFNIVDTISLSLAGTPLSADFIHDADSTTEDQIGVLSSTSTGSSLTVYTQPPSDNNPLTIEHFAASGTLKLTDTTRNFTPVYDATGALQGDALLAGSMGHITFTPDLTSTTTYALPFASKVVSLTGGNGGDGLNLGKVIGKGGNGGSVTGINVDANQVLIVAGDGGTSQSGAAGSGGSVINPTTFTTASGAIVVPTLTADEILQITAGAGKSALGPAAKTATGGNGGALSGLSLTLDAGDISLTTGIGGDGDGGNAGSGGSMTSMKTLMNDGSLTLSTGHGGNATSGTGAGGNGGSINNFSHELQLDPDVEQLEKGYSVTITTGSGGTSVGGLGGSGGSLNTVALKLDGPDRTYDDNSVNPPLVDAHRDSTVRVSVTTGNGGQGANGGVGGSIRGFSSSSVFDQITKDNVVLVNYVVMNLQAGHGGVGTAGNGGAGGTIALSKPIAGVTFVDPDAPVNDPAFLSPFVATAGFGGAGTIKGGAGGAVTGLTLQNSPYVNGNPLTTTQLQSALVTAGYGGNGGTSDGGAGGSVTTALIGTEGGFLSINAGHGGNGGTTGKGGVGGSVSGSTFGVVVTSASVGLSITAGYGGDGGLSGGLGGSLASLQVSTPQSTNGISAILLAGNGGKATTAKAIGGKGGDVAGLTQAKDVNSSINLIQAGNGGDNAIGTAGAGGNILNLRTVGFIGRPSDGTNRLGVFDTDLPTVSQAQGLFSGRGGTGIVNGVNGSVTNVTARQIAAIAAASDSNGLFAAASKVMGVKASLIGFDVDQSGTFDSTDPALPSPSKSKPIDGFILATAISQVTVLPASSFIFNA